MITATGKGRWWIGIKKSNNMKNDHVKIIIEKLTNMELRQRGTNITDVFEAKNWERKNIQK